MATARDIMRGTFRLSIVAAALATAYGLYERYNGFSEYKNDSLKMMVTLECGARLSEERLKTAVNEVGLIDLSKVGCHSKPFSASFDELRRARDGVFRREWEAMKYDVRYAWEYALEYALAALIAINLLGLALIAVRASVGWIAKGYRHTP